MRSAGLPLTIGYTGHLWDRALGQYAAPFRYYNPATARWNMRDPLGFVDGPNVYAYVAGNPVMRIDPNGGSIAIIGGAILLGGAILIGGGILLGGIDIFGDHANRITCQSDPSPTTIEVHKRPSKGRDGGRSEMHLEKSPNGDTISRRHFVTKDGKIVHDHTEYIPKWPDKNGKQMPRKFPDEWIPKGGCK